MTRSTLRGAMIALALAWLALATTSRALAQGVMEGDPFGPNETVIDQQFEPAPYPFQETMVVGDPIGPDFDPPLGCAALGRIFDSLGGYPNYGLYVLHSYNAWHGISEGTGGNNNGFAYGGNFGSRLGAFSDWTGVGLQIGASYGLYDLNGRSSGFSNDKVQQQAFVTAGFFRKAGPQDPVSFGIVYDAMFNANFSQYAVGPYLGQLRAQISVAVTQTVELGFWTSVRMSGQTLSVLDEPVSFRPVDQFNFFYHHKFDFGGDAWTWMGFPDHTKLGGNGSLGGYIMGGMVLAPLSPRWAAYTDVQYMAPTAHIGAAASIEEAYYVGVGLVFYPGGALGAGDVIDRSWMPYQQVATNGSFLVDTSRTF